MSTRILLLLAVTMAPATAADLRLNATNTLKLGWFGNNGNDGNDASGDDHYVRLLERLDIRGRSGGVDASARVDSVYMLDVIPDGEATDGAGGTPTPREEETREARLERVLATYRTGDWRVEMGDHHLQLGRGIVLSLKPIDAAGVDVALRGGTVRYTGAPHDVAVFAGRANPVNFDAIAHRFVADTDDVIAGGQYGVRPGGWPEIGLLAAYIRPSRTGPLDTDRVNGGLYLDAPTVADWLAVYLEVDGQYVKTGAKKDNNFGAYLSADLTLGETLVLVEGLFLDRYVVRGSENSATQADYVYNRAPTLERFDQEVFDYEHVRGARVRAERALGDPDTVGHANVMYRQQAPGAANEIHQVHGYAGLETLAPGRLAISGGYRAERDTDLDPFKSMVHGELDYYLGLTGIHQLHLNGEIQHRSQPNSTGDQQTHLRGTVLLGYEMGALFTVTADLGVDTQNENDRNYFVAGVLTTKPTSWFDARLLAGTQRGGIRCIGGVCREFPAFSGVRTELVGRF